nr:hypothetical protein [Mesorhizobium loti]
MIVFGKKTEVQPAADEREQNRFEQIRKAAKEKHRKSDADAAESRARPTDEDDRLI